MSISIQNLAKLVGEILKTSVKIKKITKKLKDMFQ